MLNSESIAFISFSVDSETLILHRTKDWWRTRQVYPALPRILRSTLALCSLCWSAWCRRWSSHRCSRRTRRSRFALDTFCCPWIAYAHRNEPNLAYEMDRWNFQRWLQVSSLLLDHHLNTVSNCYLAQEPLIFCSARCRIDIHLNHLEIFQV